MVLNVIIHVLEAGRNRECKDELVNLYMEESKQEIRRAVFRTATVSTRTTASEPHLI